MMISPINPFSNPLSHMQAPSAVSASNGFPSSDNAVGRVGAPVSGEAKTGTAAIKDDMEKRFPGLGHTGHKDPSECETCKKRKYQDGSDEMVSFKTAQHISPESAAARVRAHEQEHVSNAYTEAAQNNGKVLRASVSIHTAVCPECGRTYVAGGTTSTQIKYNNEENPYQKNRKAREYTAVAGENASFDV